MLVNARGDIYRFQAPTVIKDTLNEVNFHIDICCLWKYSYRCPLLEEGFIKVMNGLVMTLKEDKRFLSGWLLIHGILCSLRR